MKFRDAIAHFNFDLDGFLSRPPSRTYDREEKTYLYLFHTGEYHKIGIAKDVKKRLKQLRDASPYDVGLVAVRGFPNILYALSAEKAAHTMLAPHAHRNEWFMVDRDTAKIALISAFNAVRLLERRHRKFQQTRARDVHTTFENENSI